MLKTCKDCGQALAPTAEFWIMHKGKIKGLACKKCRNAKAYPGRLAWRRAQYNNGTYKGAENAAWYRAHPEVAFARNAKRRAAKLQRTVLWADYKAIKAIYAEAIQRTRETGVQWQVDHVIPLQGKLVSGLHVETNLQIIKAVDNFIKNNRFEV